MKFFVLAGGYGLRARPLSQILPKPVFPLNGVPLLTIMLTQLYSKGVKEGFINLHHLGEKIRCCAESFTGITFFYEKTLTGSRIIKRTGGLFDDLLLVVNGDVFLDIPIKKMVSVLQRQSGDAVLLVRKVYVPGYSALQIENRLFCGIQKPEALKMPAIQAGYYMYCGVALMTKDVVKRIDDMNFLHSLIRNKMRVLMVELAGLWLDIGNPQLYYDANFHYKKEVGDTTPNALSENVSISSDSHVDRSIVWGNSVILNGSEIVNCIVTGNLILDGIKEYGRILMPHSHCQYDIKP